MDAFLEQQFGTIDWPKVPGAKTFQMPCVRFSVAEFSSTWFQQVGIECPGQIAGASRKRQAEFFFGRLSAKAALHQLDQPHFQIGIGPLREPVWPPQIVGSITHTDSIAAALAVKSVDFRGIGIDIETVIDLRAADAVRATVTTAAELQYLSKFETGIEPLVLLTLVFSAKESFFKATCHAIQRYLDFDAIELTKLDPEAQVMDFRVRYALGPGWFAGACTRVYFQRISPSLVATLCLW